MTGANDMESYGFDREPDAPDHVSWVDVTGEHQHAGVDDTGELRRQQVAALPRPAVARPKEPQPLAPTEAALPAVSPPPSRLKVTTRNRVSRWVLPALVLMLSGGLGAYLWLYLSTIPTAVLVFVLGIAGAALSRVLLSDPEVVGKY